MSYAVLCENCAAVCGLLHDEEKQRNYLQAAADIKASL